MAVKKSSAGSKKSSKKKTTRSSSGKSKAKKTATKASARRSKPTSKKVSRKPPAGGKKKTTKPVRRRSADFSDDVEMLTSVEIEQELKAYDEEKPKEAPRRPEPSSEAGRLAHRIAGLMYEKKAEDVVMADMIGLTSVTDFFVIATATSDLHAKAIADHIEDQLHLSGIRVHHKEGYQSLKWVLLDYVDVIAHVFQGEARVFYDLENLWGDARFEAVADTGGR